MDRDLCHDSPHKPNSRGQKERPLVSWLAVTGALEGTSQLPLVCRPSWGPAR